MKREKKKWNYCVASHDRKKNQGQASPVHGVTRSVITKDKNEDNQGQAVAKCDGLMVKMIENVHVYVK